MKNIDSQLEIIKQGAAEIIQEPELIKKLKSIPSSNFVVQFFLISDKSFSMFSGFNLFVSFGNFLNLFEDIIL